MRSHGVWSYWSSLGGLRLDEDQPSMTMLVGKFIISCTAYTACSANALKAVARLIGIRPVDDVALTCHTTQQLQPTASIHRQNIYPSSGHMGGMPDLAGPHSNMSEDCWGKIPD